MSIGGRPNFRSSGDGKDDDHGARQADGAREIEAFLHRAKQLPLDDTDPSPAPSAGQSALSGPVSDSVPAASPRPAAPLPPRLRFGGINGCAAAGLIGLVLAIVTIVILVNVIGLSGGSATTDPSANTNSSGITTDQTVATSTPVLTAPSGVDQSTVQNDAINAYNSLDTSFWGDHVGQILDVMASAVFSSNQDLLTDDGNGTGYVPSVYYYVDGCMDYIWRPNDPSDTAHWGQEELVVIYEWNYLTSAWEIAVTNAAHMLLDNGSASCSNLPQTIIVY